MSRDELLYFVYYGYERTVVESQVLVPARLLSRMGQPVRVVFMESPGGLLRWLVPAERRRRARMTAGLAVTVLPRVPRNAAGLDTLVVTLRFFARLRDGVVVHARGFQGTAVWLPLRRRFARLRLVCDARGVEADEHALTVRHRTGRPPGGADAAWVDRLRAIERAAVEGADAVFHVSTAFAERFRELGYALRPGAPTVHVPCDVNAENYDGALAARERTRAHLGWTDKLVLVYSGGTAAWQDVERLPDLFCRAREIDPNVELVVLTPKPEAVRSLFRGVAGTRIESLPFPAVRERLAAADVGLLLREADPVNRYACPTKFAEYLASGLHVLTTSAILDVARFVREKGVGTVLGEETPDEAALRAALAAARDRENRIRRSVAAARAHFDWSVHLPAMKAAYAALRDKPDSGS